MELERAEADVICDNCHRAAASVRISGIGEFGRDLVLCEGCLAELRELIGRGP